MVGILFSTSKEATPFLKQRTGERHVELSEGEHATFDDLVVGVTGPGKIKATLETERLLQAHSLDELVHAGGATALTDDLTTGSLVGATFVLEGDRVELDAPTYPRMPLEAPFDFDTEGTLVTQDHVNDEDPEEKSYWERIADLRDNTGYAVAYVAAQHGTSCHIMKGISGQIGSTPDPEQERDVYTALATALSTYMEASDS